MTAMQFPQTATFYAGSFHAAGITLDLGKLLLPRP